MYALSTLEKVINTLYEIASETDEMGFMAFDESTPRVEIRYNPNCNDKDMDIISGMILIFDEFDPDNDGENYRYEDITIHIAPYEE